MIDVGIAPSTKPRNVREKQQNTANSMRWLLPLGSI